MRPVYSRARARVQPEELKIARRAAFETTTTTTTNKNVISYLFVFSLVYTTSDHCFCIFTSRACRRTSATPLPPSSPRVWAYVIFYNVYAGGTRRKSGDETGRFRDITRANKSSPENRSFGGKNASVYSTETSNGTTEQNGGRDERNVHRRS